MCQIVYEYIERLYFELINLPKNIPKTLNLIFENVVKNGLKSYRKFRQAVFDILGVSYSYTDMNSMAVA